MRKEIEKYFIKSFCHVLSYSKRCFFKYQFLNFASALSFFVPKLFISWSLIRNPIWRKKNSYTIFYMIFLVLYFYIVFIFLEHCSACYQIISSILKKRVRNIVLFVKNLTEPHILLNFSCEDNFSLLIVIGFMLYLLCNEGRFSLITVRLVLKNQYWVDIWGYNKNAPINQYPSICTFMYRNVQILGINESKYPLVYRRKYMLYMQAWIRLDKGRNFLFVQFIFVKRFFFSLCI